MDELSTLRSLGVALRTIAATPADQLAPGTVIDEQYEVERVVGSGAMGVVYLARDRRLERNVAIKVTKETSPKALAYASREAVSLARLSHPNVVVIHQVGELGRRVYVAMEYVAGANAREWATVTRSASEVLAVYLAAGEGLAAAHAAGVIHRDFKPDNILVGNDGRARVADFGLTGVDEGVVAGTPAYMAPEAVADERSDQFSFCVSLWEALCGQRPFKGDSIEALRAAIRAGEPQRGERRMPRHVEAALRRGMAADRRERWPALEPLLVELRRDPSRRKKQALVALPAFAALVIGGVVVRQPVIDACGDGAARIGQHWNPAVAARLQAALAPATTWDLAAVTAAASTTTAWADRWAGAYREVCHAGWSSSLHDRGMLCLSRAEHGLSATLAAFGPNVIGKLDKALAELPRPEACADPSYVEADVPPARNPAIALATTNFDAELQLHNTLLATGQIDRAVHVLHELEQRTELEPASRAKLDLARGITRWMLDEPTAPLALQQAYFESRTAGARATAARAAGHLSMFLLDQSKLDAAALWAQLAITESTDLGADVTVPPMLAQASVEIARNHAERAIALMTEALAMVRDPQSKLYADVLGIRADAYDHHGDLALALADTDRVRETYAKLSAANVAYVSVEISRSNFLIHAGRFDEALQAARHAVEMATTLVAEDNTVVGNAKGALGTALEYTHHYDEALGLLQESLAINRTQGERSYNVASDHNNLCDLLERMHRDRDAIAECELAIEMWPESTGPNSGELAESEVNLGNAHAALVQYPTALRAYSRAIEILATRPDDGRIVMPLVDRARVHRVLGDDAAARKDLAQAAPLVGTSGPKDWPFQYDLELARLEQREHHLDRAHALAVTARDGFAALHDSLEREAAGLATQLAP